MTPEYIGTMGPSIHHYEKILELYQLGLRIIRFNMSHIDYNIFSILSILHNIEKNTGNKIETLLDTCGAEIRIYLTTSRNVNIGEKLILGQDFTMNVSPTSILTFGDILQIDDGKIQLQVIDVSPLTFISLNSGKLKNGAGVYCEKLSQGLPFIPEKDKEHYALAFANDLDWVACSFVKSASNIKEVLEIKSRYPNCHTKIMSKIETREAVQNLDEIIAISDGIMIARGDLGVAFPVSMIATLQNYIAGKVIDSGKPLTIGTGFLRSMKKSPIPEKAEVTDLYYAFTLSNSIMFSGETAVADDPAHILRTANTIFNTLKTPFNKEKVYIKDVLGG